MIEVTETVVSKFVDLALGRIISQDESIQPFRRMLALTDPNYSIAVFPSTWMPDEDSHEIGNVNAHEPTLQRYQVGIHVLTKDSDRERGLAVHTAYARLVRMVLYRDPILRVGLGSLAVTDSFGKESFRRGWATSHRYLSKELGNNQLAYLSVLDYTLETEMQ